MLFFDEILNVQICISLAHGSSVKKRVAVRPLLDVYVCCVFRVELTQNLHCVVLAVFNCFEEGSSPCVVLLNVRIGVVLQQKFERVVLPKLAGVVEWRFAEFILHVKPTTVLNKERDDF